MKKIMMLGGAATQLAAIKKAKDLGYYVIVCDACSNAPGKKLADEFYAISTTNKQAILQLAKERGIDGIVCYAADSGALTVAYVAEQLQLPGHPYESIEILTNKALFRQFQQRHHFHTPRAQMFQTTEQAMENIEQFTLPVMIKPVDSSGSRGVSKASTIEELDDKIKHALAFSPSKRFIVEEYIESDGPHIGGDGFSVDGELVFRSFSNEYFKEDGANPFVPVITTWPCEMNDRILQQVHQEIQRLLQLLKMRTGAYNFDIRIDQDENVYIIELAPRNGGDYNPEAIYFATGVDLITYTLRAAVDEPCHEIRMVEPAGYWATYVMNSTENGVLKDVTIDRQFVKEHIVVNDLYVRQGAAVSALTGSHEKLGLMILKFPSKQDMKNKLHNIEKHVKLKVEQKIMAVTLSVILLQEKLPIIL